MKPLRIFAAVAVLLLPFAAHASPGDAVAVVQSCGAPITDTTTSGPEAPPERILHYRRADLHFQQDLGGWNFLFATADNQSRMIDRAQTAEFLPCFQKAMDSVRANTAAQPVAAPPASTPGWREWLMQPVFGLRRIGYLPLLLLYLLPSIIGFVRRPPRLRTLVLIDLFFGWTLVGWAYALLLSNEDPASADDAVVPEYDDAVLATHPRSGMLHLNLIDSAETADGELPISSPQPERHLRPQPHSRRSAAAAPGLEPAPLSKPDDAEPPVSSPKPEPALPQHPLYRRHARSTPILQPAPVAEPAPRPEPEPIRNEPAPLSSFGVTFAPRAIDPNPRIHWTEQFSPARRCSLEVLAPSRQVTLYEMDLTQRGFDDDGHEYLGGYSNRIFFAFPTERILNLRDVAA